MEKMKPKQVIENLEQMKDHLETYNQQALVPYSQKYIQAIDHAINCVGAIEQIRAERDIAIQQLNELGYGFGEKIRSDEKNDRKN